MNTSKEGPLDSLEEAEQLSLAVPARGGGLCQNAQCGTWCGLRECVCVYM